MENYITGAQYNLVVHDHLFLRPARIVIQGNEVDAASPCLQAMLQVYKAAELREGAHAELDNRVGQWAVIFFWNGYIQQVTQAVTNDPNNRYGLLIHGYNRNEAPQPNYIRDITQFFRIGVN